MQKVSQSGKKKNLHDFWMDVILNHINNLQIVDLIAEDY